MITILDGYIDTPACLGVPPYISPEVRYIYGAIKDAKEEVNYLTIDEYRNGSDKVKRLFRSPTLVIVSGALVPGKYIRAMPISFNEVVRICEGYEGVKILGGPAAVFGFGGEGRKRSIAPEEIDKYFDHLSKGDADACIYDYITEPSVSARRRGNDEWKKWSKLGASIVTAHPDFPQPLITEIETSRGCVRYFTGGCSFCMEPSFGEPIFRDPEDIIEEIGVLSELGVTNFRLGSQSCFFSYKAKGVGETETPRPDPKEIERLLKGIRNVSPGLRVLHLDNANPAVIAENIEESRAIIRSIIEHCTSGNALAFGMESADLKVISANNLNSTPEQVLTAIELFNEYGREPGENGMPRLLPGLNFIAGLRGESRETFQLNYDFLEDIMEKELLLRRINIRQVLSMGDRGFDTRKNRSHFIRFKKKVREDIDRKMLKKIAPGEAILKDAFIELKEKNMTYARQIGTYPLLIGVPYYIESDGFVDVKITDHGFRSITGVEYPFQINRASLKALQALPKVGAKRARRLIIQRPYTTEEEFISAMDDGQIASSLLKYVRFD